MTSAEGLSAEEKKDIKLKLKIKLTKSGGFISLKESDCHKKTSSEVDCGNSNKVHNDHMFKKGHLSLSHGKVESGDTEYLACTTGQKKKTRKRKHRCRLKNTNDFLKVNNPDRLREPSFGNKEFTEHQYFETCSNMSLPPGSPCGSSKLEPKVPSLVVPDVVDGGTETAASNSLLNLSSTSTEDDYDQQILLQPGHAHKMGKAPAGYVQPLTMQPFLQSTQHVSPEYSENYVKVASVQFCNENIDDISGDNVDSHFHLTEADSQHCENCADIIPITMQSEGGTVCLQSKEECGTHWTDTRVLTVTEAMVPAKVDSPGGKESENLAKYEETDSKISDDIASGILRVTKAPCETSPNVIFHDCEINNNLSESPAAGIFNSVAKEQDPAHNQSSPYPEMLITSNFAEMTDTARGSKALTSMIKSTTTQAFGYVDAVVSVKPDVLILEGSVLKDDYRCSSAVTSDRRFKKESHWGKDISSFEEDPKVLLAKKRKHKPIPNTEKLHCSLSKKRKFWSSATSYSNYHAIGTLPHGETPAMAVSATCLQSHATHVESCLGHSTSEHLFTESELSRQSIEVTAKLPNTQAQSDRVSPDVSKICGCKNPIPQDFLAHSKHEGNESVLKSWQTCLKCSKCISKRKSKIPADLHSDNSDFVSNPSEWCRCKHPFSQDFPGNTACDGSATLEKQLHVCLQCKKHMPRYRPKNPDLSKCCRCKNPFPQDLPGNSACGDGAAIVKQLQVCLQCMKRIPKRKPKKLSEPSSANCNSDFGLQGKSGVSTPLKKCRCKYPVPKETSELDQMKTSPDERYYLCKKCEKLITIYEAKKETEHPVASNTQHPSVSRVFDDHNYCRLEACQSDTHLSFSSLNKMLGEISKVDDKTFRTAPESSKKVAIYVFPPKFDTHRQITFKEYTNSTETTGSNWHTVSIDCTAPPPSSRAEMRETDDTIAQVTGGYNKQIVSGCCINTDYDCSDTNRQKKGTPKARQTHLPISHSGDSDLALLGAFGLQPCYVVLERRPSYSHHCVDKPPCPHHCRAESLDFLCEFGKLRQCKHTHLKQSSPSRHDHRQIGSLKQDFLRRSKTLEGYEEYRQQQLQSVRLKRLKENGMCESNTAISDRMDVFFPLSSLCDQETTGVQTKDSDIKAEDMISSDIVSPSHPMSHQSSDAFVQQKYHNQPKKKTQRSEDSKARPTRFSPRRRVDRLENSSPCCSPPEGADGDDKKFPVSGFEYTRPYHKRDQIYPGRTDAISKLFHDKENEHSQLFPRRADEYNSLFPEKEKEKLKMSKFDVKYYVFEADDRAFVVPLIRSSCKAGSVNRLDDEDLLYVKTMISFLLEEKTSCARHLGYPNCIKLKRKTKGVASKADTEKCKPLLVGSVEEFHLECLKMVANDKQTLGLVPENSQVDQVSLNENLVRIGEEVFMYLTGQAEDAPPWIKELGKKIVRKHKQRISNRNRLKPSKDITIEIDYAEEGGDVDVGNEEESSGVNSDGSLNVAGSSVLGDETQPAFMKEVTREVSLQSEYGLREAELSLPIRDNARTGSFVSDEVFIQERKPLLNDLLQASQSLATSSADTCSVPLHGQHLSIPLPQDFDHEEGTHGLKLHHSMPVTSEPSSECSTGFLDPFEEVEKKPLAHELLSMSSVSVPLQADYNCWGQHPTSNIQQETSVQNPAGTLAVVKQEPPDDVFPFVSSGRGQETNQLSQEHAFPFVYSATVEGLVQADQEPSSFQGDQENGSPAEEQYSPKFELSKLSPWMMPDVEHRASVHGLSEKDFEMTNLLGQNRHVVAMRNPFLESGHANTDNENEGCGDALCDPCDGDAELCDDECDGCDVTVDTVNENNSGKQDCTAESDKDTIIPVITEVCGAGAFGHKLEDNKRLLDHHQDHVDGPGESFPIITEVCGGDSVGFVDVVVAAGSDGAGNDYHLAPTDNDSTVSATAVLTDGNVDLGFEETGGKNASLPIIAEVMSGGNHWTEEEADETSSGNAAAGGPVISKVISCQQVGASFLTSANETEAAAGGREQAAQGCGLAIVKQEPREETTAEYPAFSTTNSPLGDSGAFVKDHFRSSPPSQLLQDSHLTSPFQLSHTLTSADKGGALMRSLALLSAEITYARAPSVSKSPRKPKGKNREWSATKLTSQKLRKKGTRDAPSCPSTDASHASADGIASSSQVACPSAAPASPSAESRDDIAADGVLSQSVAMETTSNEALFLSSDESDDQCLLISLSPQTPDAVSPEQEAPALSSLDVYKDTPSLCSVAPTPVIQCDSSYAFERKGGCDSRSTVLVTCDANVEAGVTAADPIVQPAVAAIETSSCKSKKKSKPAKRGWGGGKRSRTKKLACTSSASDQPNNNETRANFNRLSLDLGSTSESSVPPETVSSLPKKIKLEDRQTPACLEAAEPNSSAPNIKCVTANLNFFLSKLKKAREGSDKAGTGKKKVISGSEVVSSQTEIASAAVKTGSDAGRKNAGKTVKSVHERSFFDCLPEDFLSAWKG